jgi:hypothetical protein
MMAMAIISKETRIRTIRTIKLSLTTTTMAVMQSKVTAIKVQMDITMSRKCFKA